MADIPRATKKAIADACRRAVEELITTNPELLPSPLIKPVSDSSFMVQVKLPANGNAPSYVLITVKESWT